MGLYTWVSQYCCNQELQFQSKAGPKEWGEWELSEVPKDVANDINGDTQTCGECGARYEIRKVLRERDTVPMEIVCIDKGRQEDEDEDEESLGDRLSRIEKELGIRK